MKILTTTNVLLAVLVGLTVYGLFFSGHAFGASPAGSTFSTAKTAMVVWAPSTTAATTTSILNPDSQDRVIKQINYWCLNLAAVNNANLTSVGWRFQAATTSVASLGIQGNANILLDMSVPTTTAELFVASTTPGGIGTGDFRRWATGSYLSFNANASSTATCVIGVDYFGT